MSDIQSIIFSKKYFTEEKADEWLKKHNHHSIKPVHETENMLRYRQNEPNYKHYFTKKVQQGVEFIIGYK